MRMRFVRAEDDDSWRRNAFWELVRVLKWKHKPNFVDPDSRWTPPADLQAEFEAVQAAKALPRTCRPGGRFGKRPRPLAIEVLTLGRLGCPAKSQCSSLGGAFFVSGKRGYEVCYVA